MADIDTGAATTADDLAPRNIALLRRYLEGLSTGDLGDLREILHPEISFELPFVAGDSPRVTKGFDDVVAYLRGLSGFVESMRLYDFRIHTFADDPNELVAEYRSDMTLRGGRPYENTYITRATVRDGKLVLFREHFDPIAFVEAMGGSVTLPQV
jgi:ketosteroid isomerase-like protein